MVPARDPVTGKSVQFMATCLCDLFYDQAAKAAVEVLESLGCDVVFPPDQTCCGQPGYTAGDWDACRSVMRHVAHVFEGDEPIVVPAGSCAAALFHEGPLAFEDQPDRDRILALGRRTWEFTDFIFNGLGCHRWPGRLDARIVLHRGCHNRDTPTVDAATRLLSSIDGLELLETEEPEQCCGFGGVFSVAFPHLSGSIGDRKVRHLLAPRPDYIVSPDMSCLLHQSGLAERQGLEFPVRHVAEILRAASLTSGAPE